MTHEMMDASQSFIDFDEPIKEKTPLQSYEAFSESFISREIFSDTEQDLMHFQRMKNNMNMEKATTISCAGLRSLSRNKTT